MVSADKRKKNHDVHGYGYSGIVHRDFRHSKGGPEVTGPPRKRRPKPDCPKATDKVHVILFSYYEYIFVSIRRSHCINCGRDFSRNSLKKIKWRKAEGNEK